MKKLPFFSFLLVVLIASCGPKPEEQVKEFAVKFGDFVNTNQKDSIQKYYPDFELTDSLNNVPVGNIIVEKGEKEGSYIVKYSPGVSLFIALGKDGKIDVEQSMGLIVIDENGLNLIKEANLWNEDLKDKELKELVVEQIRQDSIANEDNLRIKPQYFLSFDTDGQQKMKSLGFKKVREKIEEDDQIGIEEGEVIYERVLNGRKIIYQVWWSTCSGETLTFQDPSDLERFKEDLQNLGFKKNGCSYTSKKFTYHPEISIEGNKVSFASCS